MEINEVRRVGSRFDLRVCGMAQLAAERRLDGCVTHQTIGHLRVVGRSRGIAFRQTTMTRRAGVLSLQLLSSRSCRRQVGSTVDGCNQGGSHISKSQMLLMAELQRSRRALEHISFLPFIVLHRMQAVVAGQASFGLGQIVVSREPA